MEVGAAAAQELSGHQLFGGEQLYCASHAVFIHFVVVYFLFLFKLFLSKPTGSCTFQFSLLSH